MTAMIHHSLTNHHSSTGLGRAGRAGRAGWAGRAASLAGEWLSRLRERDALARLSERDLHDLGLSRLDAQQEADKPFWRA